MNLELKSNKSYHSTAAAYDNEESAGSLSGTQSENSRWQRLVTRVYPSGFKSETINLLKIAIPVIVTNFFTFLIMTESVIMCGHLTKIELDSAALGNSIINALGLSVATGLSTACDTFFSQIFGSPHKKSMGMMLQRSLLVMTIFPFFIIALFLNMEPIFLALGQDPEVAVYSAKYMALFSPGVFFGFHFLALARYMQNQDLVLPPMLIVIAANVFNVLSQYICIYVLGWGFSASAICQMFTYILMWLLEVLYIYFSKLYVDTWDGWTKEAFLDWGNFLSLGIPGIAMVVMETFCWEIGTFLSGLLGTTELGAQSVLFQLETITFQIAFGVSVAVNIRVGQGLGSMQPKKALTAYRCGLTIMLISASLTGTLFILLNDSLPRLFTSEIDVIEMSSKILVVLIFVQILDGQSCVTLGALRGCGRQKLGTVFIFLAYYLLGQPIGISLAFLTELRVSGLWIGLLCALMIMVPLALIVTNCQNWEYYAQRAQERINSTAHNPENELSHYDERSSLLHNEEESSTTSKRAKHHQRMPSQPRISSLSVAQVTAIRESYNRSQVNYSGIIMRRLLIYLIAIIVLIVGIILSFYGPWQSSEQPWHPTTNNTMLASDDDFYLAPEII